MAELSGLLTIGEAAHCLGRSRSTVRDAVLRGTLPVAGRLARHSKRGALIIVRERDVREYAKRNGIAVKT